MELGKTRTELQLQLETLVKVHGWATEAMPTLGLTPLPVQDRDAISLLVFLTNLMGQLAALPDALVARARREGRQIVEATARLILSRMRFLAPNFPFAALLEEFATQEEEDEATAAVQPVVNKVKKAAKRD